MKNFYWLFAALFVVGLATFYLLPSSSKPADANVVFQDASGKKLTEKTLTENQQSITLGQVGVQIANKSSNFKYIKKKIWRQS